MSLSKGSVLAVALRVSGWLMIVYAVSQVPHLLVDVEVDGISQTMPRAWLVGPAVLSLAGGLLAGFPRQIGAFLAREPVGRTLPLPVTGATALVLAGLSLVVVHLPGMVRKTGDWMMFGPAPGGGMTPDGAIALTEVAMVAGGLLLMLFCVRSAGEDAL